VRCRRSRVQVLAFRYKPQICDWWQDWSQQSLIEMGKLIADRAVDRDDVLFGSRHSARPLGNRVVSSQFRRRARHYLTSIRLISDADLARRVSRRFELAHARLGRI
jgi:hypothetical protein